MVNLGLNELSYIGIKMDKKQLKETIHKLGPWYQKINLDGISTNTKRDVAKTWALVKREFPIYFNNKRILDLGANAGYYSIRAAMEGASLISIEAYEKSYNQFLFLKEYYEKLGNIKLDIEYINKDISDIDFSKLGKFDYIFAFSILYHIGNFKYGKGTKKSFIEQERVMNKLVKLSDNILVRARERKRNKNEFYNPSYYNKVFKKFGFEEVKTIYENTQKRSFVMYKNNGL